MFSLMSNYFSNLLNKKTTILNMIQKEETNSLFSVCLEHLEHEYEHDFRRFVSSNDTFPTLLKVQSEENHVYTRNQLLFPFHRQRYALKKRKTKQQDFQKQKNMNFEFTVIDALNAIDLSG